VISGFEDTIEKCFAGSFYNQRWLLHLFRACDHFSAQLIPAKTANVKTSPMFSTSFNAARKRDQKCS
jgi:hypothetical protein